MYHVLCTCCREVRWCQHIPSSSRQLHRLHHPSDCHSLDLSVSQTVQKAGSLCIKNLKLKNIQLVAVLRSRNYLFPAPAPFWLPFVHNFGSGSGSSSSPSPVFPLKGAVSQDFLAFFNFMNQTHLTLRRLTLRGVRLCAG